ncbi:MAG: HAD-IIB family hydrolase [Spirochaetota bacterium]
MLNRGIVITDLDGTLLYKGKPISDKVIKILVTLGEKGIIRVIATGRSLYSARTVLPEDFPIDFLIFSSGAGIIDWKTGRLLVKQGLRAEEVKRALNLLLELKVDFMIHDPIPENHRFKYYGEGKNNPDFFRRISIYRDFATPGNPSRPWFQQACQFVAIEPPVQNKNLYQRLKTELAPLKVIRTTSPIDGQSTWIEVFPQGVSKAKGAEYICSLHNIPLEATLAIGNDYNDIDLLSWAATSYVVENAPEELKRRFPGVSSEKESGFIESVERWLKR